MKKDAGKASTNDKMRNTGKGRPDDHKTKEIGKALLTGYKAKEIGKGEPTDFRVRNVEILAPAGSMESLRAAVCAGADAVYAGGERFGARAYAENMSGEELLSAIDYAHLHGCRFYLTVNTLFKDSEIGELYDYLNPCYERGLDAVIVQDIGVMDFVREAFPGLSVHVSTQATVTGACGAAFYERLGASRVVPARELSLSEIRDIRAKTGLEIECFVHGALCYCYSGQCLMSSMIGGRSGNRGQCAQPCRLPYALDGEKPRELLSLKDLCTIDRIPELVEAGIDSFKIEGRMKQPAYVYTVTRMYRKYTDLYLNGGTARFRVDPEDKKALTDAYRRRGYTDGYYWQHNGRDMISSGRLSGEEAPGLVPAAYKSKEKINGKLTLSEGERATLYVEGCGASASFAGETVQTAVKQPLDAVRIEQQMRKTGNTPFEFDRLEIEIKGSVFLPMQALNELRREGLALLEREILKPYERKAGIRPAKANVTLDDAETGPGVRPAEANGQPGLTLDDVETEPGIRPANENGRKGAESPVPEKDGSGFELSVLVSGREQLDAVSGDPRVSIIYAGGNAAFETMERRPGNDGQRLFHAMPYIFRKDAAEIYERFYPSLVKHFDGVLIRNLDSYEWLMQHGYGKEIHADDTVYAFNRRSKQILRELGISRFCAPAELNCGELKALGLDGGTLIVHGYHPVMISANCVRKTAKTCNHRDGVVYLTDRYRNRFPVRCACRFCYNVIYNCEPLMLIAQQTEIAALDPAGLRIDLLTESAEETEEILSLYADCFQKGRRAEIPAGRTFTRGHFRRGVK